MEFSFELHGFLFDIKDRTDHILLDSSHLPYEISFNLKVHVGVHLVIQVSSSVPAVREGITGEGFWCELSLDRQNNRV